MKKSLLLGFLSRGISLAGNLILLPLILSNLTNSEYVIWTVFLSTLSLAILLDCGFASVISRYFTYILSGCRELPDGRLKESKNNITEETTTVDCKLFTLVYRFSTHLYLLLSLILSTVLIIFWSMYLSEISAAKDIDLLVPWSLFSLAIVITLYFNKYNAYFFGIKRVSSVYKIGRAHV